MMKIHEYMSAVKQEDYYYKHGLLTRQELDRRLQKIAKKYDREFFRFNRGEVITNGNT